MGGFPSGMDMTMAGHLAVNIIKVHPSIETFVEHIEFYFSKWPS
jgi:hypothetical protein